MAKKIVLSNNPLFSGPSYQDRESGGAIPYREISISSIERDPNQPRVNFEEEKLNELADSIRTYGVLTPIMVKAGKLPGKYVLVAGERRFRAAQKVGLASIPAIVDSEKDEDGERTLAIQLVENLQRADLAPLEKAYAISALKESYELSIREVAGKLGISKSAVQRSLDLLDLPDDLISALRQGASESKILVISKITDPKERAVLLKQIDSISREDLILKVKPKKSQIKTRAVKQLSPEDRRIVDEMQKSLGLKVGISRSSGKEDAGKLSINFHSESDLQTIFRRLVA